MLQQHPDAMQRLPKCSCGAQSYRVDRWMNNRDTRAMSCNCSGYVHLTRDPNSTVWLMHRKGSPYCWYRKDGSQRMPGDPDFKDAQVDRMSAEERNDFFNPEKEAA